MIVNTWLRKNNNWSPLTSQAVVRPKGASTKRVLVSSLILTSLVDAFSILVIFLLMNASSGIETIEIEKGTRLPMAVSAESLSDGVVLKFENGAYYIGKTPVALEELATTLAEEKKKEAERIGNEDFPLIIQADKEVDYKDLSPVLEVGAVNGFKQYKLAVLQKSAR